MQRDGFKDGDVVLIRKVQESNTTPGRWTNVVNDTQYAIGRKVLVKSSTEELSSPEGAHLIPHAKLRLAKNGKSAPPRKVEVNNTVWLAEAHSWPTARYTKTLPQGTQVRVVEGPLSKRGGNTAHISNPSFWNYQVAYLVHQTRIDIQKHSSWVDAENFHTTAEREPANPTT